LSGPLFPDGIRQEYDLTWLLTLTHEQYLEAFRGTAIRRAKVWMLRRNAAVALGNAGGESCVAPLFNAMNRDDHPIVRGHAAWALGRIRSRLGSEAARKALELALSSEIDEQVLREIKAALRPRDNVTAARG
jgi:epoxyqueuosine reductase